MSVQSQIDRIEQNVTNTYAVLAGLGADMPSKQNSDNLAMTAGTAKVVLYSQQTLTEEQKEQARQNIGIIGTTGEIPSIVLPSKLYAVVGHEFILYYRNILRAMMPEDFVVSAKITDSKLTNKKPLYADYIRFTPTEDMVGSYSVTILVKNRRTWVTVAEKTVSIVVYEDKSRSGKKVMFIGDSLTDACVYPAEIQKMTDNGVMSVGTLSKSISFDGGTVNVKTEGRSGAASYDYVNKKTVSGGVNPFYNPNTEYSLTLDEKYSGTGVSALLTTDTIGDKTVLKHHFDFAYYMANNAAVGVPDAVFINLGSNGGNKSSYKTVHMAFCAMVDRIRAYSATMPIFIHLFPPKSEAGSIERNASGQFSGLLNERTWYYDIIQYYIDKWDNDPRVTLVPTYAMIDTVYDFKRETVAVSARNSEQITIGQTDGVHPATSGYLHMADSYYNALQALWSGEVDTYYTITNNLTNVTNSNTATEIKEGSSYVATLTAANGYALDSVSVKMGGSAVSVTGGVINIPAVTGDIVITATAKKAVANLVDPSTANDSSPNTAIFADEWVNGYRFSSSSFSSQTLATGSGVITTDLIPVNKNSKLRIEGFDISTTGNKDALRVVFYNADGSMTRATYYQVATVTDNAVVDQTLLANGIMLVTISGLTQIDLYPDLAYARICGKPVGGNNSNIIVTVE